MSNENVADRTRLCQITVKIIRDSLCFLCALLSLPSQLGKETVSKVCCVLVGGALITFCVVTDILLCFMTCIIVTMCFIIKYTNIFYCYFMEI